MIAGETESISSAGFPCPRTEGSDEVDEPGDLPNAVWSRLKRPLKGLFEEPLKSGVFASAMSVRVKDKSRPAFGVT
jgi:hypothetical protein